MNREDYHPLEHALRSIAESEQWIALGKRGPASSVNGSPHFEPTKAGLAARAAFLRKWADDAERMIAEAPDEYWDGDPGGEPSPGYVDSSDNPCAHPICGHGQTVLLD